jgi:hypothetical protein
MGHKRKIGTIKQSRKVRQTRKIIKIWKKRKTRTIRHEGHGQ